MPPYVHVPGGGFFVEPVTQPMHDEPITPPVPVQTPSRYTPPPMPTEPTPRTTPFRVDPNTLGPPPDATLPITPIFAPRFVSPTPVSDSGTGTTPTKPDDTKPTGGTTTTTTTPTTGGSATGGAADTDLIKTLMGLVANQYAGAGVSGGGSGFDGTVTAPISSEPLATDAAPASSGGGKGILFLVLGVAVVGGLWYWHKHKKGKAA